jgi:3-oxoacyl-[acyl-carrier-protein] synthase II
MTRRVVVTGIGVVSPIGIGKAAFCNGLREGLSGIRPITLFDASNFPVKFSGEVRGFDPLRFMNSKQAKRMFRFSQLGLAATKMAIAEAKLELGKEDLDRVGIGVGTSIGALGYGDTLSGYFEKGVEALHPFFGSYVIPSSCATESMIEFKISGPTFTNANACTASTSAIGTAFHLIKNGEADVMVAGGAEAPITPITLGSLRAARILSEEDISPQRAYTPFSKERSGIVVGEGAAMIVLESLDHAIGRDAPIMAEFTGYGVSCDAYHVLLQPPDGQKAALAIYRALDDAGLEPRNIQYINAHGSGTIMNDKTETAIIKKVFGDYAYKIPISSTKSLIGHAMGACGALEISACVLMLEQHFLHPTINYNTSDPECDLDYIPNSGRKETIDTILKISFGFGGYNAMCTINRYR